MADSASDRWKCPARSREGHRRVGPRSPRLPRLFYERTRVNPDAGGLVIGATDGCGQDSRTASIARRIVDMECDSAPAQSIDRGQSQTEVGCSFSRTPSTSDRQSPRQMRLDSRLPGWANFAKVDEPVACRRTCDPGHRIIRQLRRRCASRVGSAGAVRRSPTHARMRTFLHEQTDA